MQDHLPRHRHASGHVSQAEGHSLVLDQGLAKALPFAGVVSGHLKSGACHPDRLRSDTDTATFEVGQGDFVAFALLAQAVGQRHAHIVKDDLAGIGSVLAEFVLDPGDLIAGGIGRNDKSADAALAGTRISNSENDHYPGILPGSDELLAAIEHIVVAVTARTGLQAAGIGARLGFGQGKGTEHLTTGKRGKKLLLLRVIAKF
ncbi:hypothetical protein D3C77_463240 [compost metagenome]